MCHIIYCMLDSSEFDCVATIVSKLRDMGEPHTCAEYLASHSSDAVLGDYHRTEKKVFMYKNIVRACNIPPTESIQIQLNGFSDGPHITVPSWKHTYLLGSMYPVRLSKQLDFGFGKSHRRDCCRRMG